ncbi:STM4014 family protein [Sphingomonas sp. HF-S3]|uniref:STM4014 family protein n=1 Tax=Sphingomonas rustica TaxID=3103142 RepID=A0ABV0B674_9SPHN
MTAPPGGAPGRIVVLGAGAGPRHDSFVAACVDRLGGAPASLAWDRFLADPDRLAAMLRPGGYLRIDTPDQQPGPIAALYRAGRDAAAAAGFETLSDSRIDGLAAGEIGSPAQLAFGLGAATARAEATARACGGQVSTSAADVACAFDKAAARDRLAAAGVPVPFALAAPESFDDLVAAMEAAGLSRVFVKLRHGSAAAGMIALARQGDRWIATTTAVDGEGGRILASRNLRRLTDRGDLARLVDRLAPLGLHVERWLPKIGIDGRVADVRLVMLDDGSIHPVLRTSRHPITNLHLGGDRAPVDALVRRIGDAAWQSVLASARSAACRFADSHVLGLDIAVLADGRRHAVLEANIFGDFVKDFTPGARSPHAAQLDRIAARLEPDRAAT